MDYLLLRKIFLDCFKIDLIDYERTNIVTIAHDTDRNLVYKGKYYAPQIDTMEDDLARRGVECVSVARIISSIKGSVSYGNARSPEGSFARALVVKRLWGKFTKQYPYSGMEERVWGDILDRTGARKVFGIQPSRELCVACHKRGIWVADVQHGLIAESHLWYGEKYRAMDPVEYLPNTFLCWDQGAEEVIGRWSARKGITPCVIGNRWLARFMRPSAGDDMAQALLQDFRHGLKQDPSKPVILVSLSWGGASIFNIPNGFIYDGLEQVIKSTRDRYHWLIRLHPNQLKGFATNEFKQFVCYFNRELAGYAEWELATRSPLPVVLKNVALHISGASSVCIEAGQMGVRSALLDPCMRDAGQYTDWFDYQRRIGTVDLVEEDPTTILHWIEENINRKEDPENYALFDQRYQELLDFLAR